jgi:hypothetical protein
MLRGIVERRSRQPRGSRHSKPRVGTIINVFCFQSLLQREVLEVG